MPLATRNSSIRGKQSSKKGAQHGHVAFGRVSLISNQEKPAHATTPRLQYETHRNLGTTELFHSRHAIVKTRGRSMVMWRLAASA